MAHDGQTDATISPGQRVHASVAGDAATPDWATISYEVPCPLCEYNLRGLREPRCPECGYGFDWREVLDPRRQCHPYLFEHHPERNASSLRQTALGSLHPATFWTTLHPAQVSRPFRLLLYWVIGLILLLVASSAGVTTMATISSRHQNALRKAELDSIERYCAARIAHVPPGPSAGARIAQVKAEAAQRSADVNRYLPATTPSAELEAMNNSGELNYFIGGTIVPFALLLPIAWCGLTLLSLFIFRWSMRRARIRRIHMLRCVLYSFDMLSWAAIYLVTMAVAAMVAAPVTNTYGSDLGFKMWLLGSLCVWAAFGARRLTCAMRSYLRFDHPRWTVLASQAIVTLCLMIPLCGVICSVLRYFGMP